jgi:hypothetical protein
MEEEKSALMMVMVMVVVMGKRKEGPWCLWGHNFKMDIT